MSLSNNGGFAEETDAFYSSCGGPFANGCGKTNQSEKYDGVVHKCPSCGQTVDAFEAQCPSCGFEFRGVEPSSRVNDLAMKLEKVSDIERRNELIRNFYIPNTKEDIFEFFILATSNIEAGGESTDAWYAKLGQAYKKAFLVFGEGPELERLKVLYSKSDKTRLINKSVTSLSHSRGVQCVALFVVGLVLTVIGQLLGSASGDPNSPFYMLGLLGLMPIMGAICLFVISISGEKN